MYSKLKRKMADKKIEEHFLSPSIPEVPIKIFDISNKIDADALVSDIYKFQEKYPVSMQSYDTRTNIRAWHSDFLTHHITPILNNLIEIKLKKIEEFGMEKKFSVDNIWINIYKNQDYARRHWHGFFGFSSVYYPYVEKDPSPIIFDNNNKSNFKILEITPLKNMLIIFPSFIYHSVPKIKEQCRISIASNFICGSNKSVRNPLDFQIKN